MPVQIIVRDSTIGEKIKEYAVEKSEKLRKYFNGITKLEVILDREAGEGVAEIIIFLAKGEPIAAKSRDSSHHAAIDSAFDHAKRGLLRHKEKIRDHKGVGGMDSVATQAPDLPEPPLESYQQIIDKTDFKP